LWPRPHQHLTVEHGLMTAESAQGLRNREFAKLR